MSVSGPLTAQGLDGVLGLVGRLYLEARVLAEQTDVDRGLVSPLA